MARTLLLPLLLAAGVLAAGCSGEPPGAPSRQPEILAVVVSGSAPAVGLSTTFKAIAQLSSGVNMDVTGLAVWTTSAPAVALVTNGVVTAVSPGSVQISAAYSGVLGRLTVNIFPAPPPGLNVFMRDYIESLMLGTGPLTPDDGTTGCPRSNRWSAYPVGTSVELLVSQTVPLAAALALNVAAAAVNEASAGQVSITIVPTANADPLPNTNQVTVTMSPTPTAMGCPYVQGCTQISFVTGTSVIRSARAILQTAQPPAAFVHDAIGHGTLGLCHVDGRGIGGPGLSLMSFGTNIFSNQIAAELSAFDRLAAISVYGSGVSRGSLRADFQAAGLVNPGPAGHVMPLSSLPDVAVIQSPRIR